ncbi:extracellular solute-binding protein (plasmid) [Embleya sp. NBC_00888]|uniref:ABC transporter substrate-binding protein n=1 Tax=Embleya sp. NBC_00888 TaxID=2975960 RepID=UPI002F912CFE|nr:extracellular solute-binding protein [Embleya sp. NBC_00888]
MGINPRRRRLTHAWAAAFTAVCCLALTACGGSSQKRAEQPKDLNTPAKKEGHLVFLEKWPDPQYAPFFKKVVADYEAANPGVTIDLQAVGDQPYKDKIRVLTSAHQLPDIYFSWAGDFTGKFVRAGLATDLSSVIGPSTEWGKTFGGPALQAFTYEGKQYGVPIDLDAKVFAYSKSAFAKAGIERPATFEALLTGCDRLKTAGYTPIAFGNQFGWPAIHYITQLNAQEVPRAVRERDNDPKTGAFTDPGYVKALQDFQQLHQRCLTQKANGISHESAQATMQQGSAAAQYVETAEFPLLSAQGVPAAFAEDWSFFRMPPIAGAPGDQEELAGAPDGLIVNPGSKNAALAVDFLKFFTNQVNAQQMTRQLGWLSPVLGSTTPENSTQQNREALELITKSPAFAGWLDAVTHTEVANAYLAGVQGLLDGSSTPQGVMKSVQAAARKAKQEVSG